MQDQHGIAPSESAAAPAAGEPDHEAIIVGAGFGGMGAAIQLGRLGLTRLAILERGGDLGGTWHVNRYPGLAVDIASFTYSYSFAPNPHWSRMFAPGEELKRYAEHVADTYGLRRHMRFNTVVESARWDERARWWEVRLRGGETLTGRYLVTATGFLSQPKVPDLPGIGTFAGKVVHSTDWDDTYDLTGRRAAVIGTGATAVQLIPVVARRVAELTVYQRTPIWVTPKLDAPIPPVVRRLFARLPVTQRAARVVNSTVLEAIMVVGVLHYRHARLANRGAELLARAHLRRQVRDPELRRKLTPRYSFGCKRPTFSNTYFPSFTLPHVRLETSPIARVEPDAIVTEDGRRTEIDTLLLATGFDLWETNFPALRITGRDGLDLGGWWRANRFQAYQGLTVPGFPNLLSLNSPYSYSGLSYFTTIEAQMRHIGRLFGELRRRGSTVFEVTREANDAFLDRVTRLLGDSVFTLGNCAPARSYYFNQHGEPALLRPTATLSTLREAGRFPLSAYDYA
ncbi:NAD(P)/FAD-dependent oxidoreductase [Streptomyces sp. DSM 44917]|uniref:NAD(P)/FAD-dependent oxidoreductase n=1 Tax=Streptomyces boetiae TaxID=3075541 RepID=A0ABU2LEE7_9ACTN|nr:NAD(P)/FAD-dependent oxidoreductase [Streptomyces sp. DSM 44917]MDT0309964.1 NAD(P)/FAD-dependent oxidoreductase [Streptomyces sp. DSM 44917]